MFKDFQIDHKEDLLICTCGTCAENCTIYLCEHNHLVVDGVTVAAGPLQSTG